MRVFICSFAARDYICAHSHVFLSEVVRRFASPHSSVCAWYCCRDWVVYWQWWHGSYRCGCGRYRDLKNFHTTNASESYENSPRFRRKLHQTRSIWQSHCVLRGCVGVDVMLHAFHLAQILRAQATRSKVSSRSVVIESFNGSLAVFPDFLDFFLDFSSSERWYQLI